VSPFQFQVERPVRALLCPLLHCELRLIDLLFPKAQGPQMMELAPRNGDESFQPSSKIHQISPAPAPNGRGSYAKQFEGLESPKPHLVSPG